MTSFTIAEIAKILEAEAFGDTSLCISSLESPDKAVAGQLALAMDSRYKDAIYASNAQAAILWPDADWKALGLKAAIMVPRARYTLSLVTQLFEKKPITTLGIHPTAHIDSSAEIGKNASIGPFCVIGSDVKIGDNARILSHCVISEGADIGDDALLYCAVVVGARVKIGDGFISQAHSTIGVDGFSYVTPQAGAIEEAKQSGEIKTRGAHSGFSRINSLGTVCIGNNVELGAGCTIDRGTLENTVIGDGSKLDNQVHIGHNVRVGSMCLLCGQVGIAGSSVIGDRVVLGGQVGVADHVNIGSDVIVAGKSGVSSHVPSGRVMMGNPAMKMDHTINVYKLLRRLPRIIAKFTHLEQRLSQDNTDNKP